MNEQSCPQNICGDNLRRTYEKIENDSKYKPTCCVGPQGPVGPATTLESILTINQSTQEVATNALLLLGTEVNSTGTNIDYDTASTITITEPGTYLIDFSALVSTTNDNGNIGATLQINGVSILTASNYIDATVTQFATIRLIHHHNAVAGDEITIINASQTSNNYQGSSLSIIKLS